MAWPICLLLFVLLAAGTRASIAATDFVEKGAYLEVSPGTKLCDPGQDVYGFYLVEGPMRPDGTQEVEYYRFGSTFDSKTHEQEAIRQPIGPKAVWFTCHPQEKNKIQVIDPRTGQADEFLYAPCRPSAP